MLSSGHAQKITPKYTFNVELGLPVAASNVPFKDIMQGLVCVSTYGQYSFPFHLNLGLGLRYSYFAVNEFSVPTPVLGGIHTGAAFMKVGWDKFHNDRFATDVGVKVGYSENFISTDLNSDNAVNPVRIQSMLVEPTVGLILSADERNSYRLSIGYCIQGYGFKPQSLGLESNSGYDPAKFDDLTRYFVFGFGYTFYIKGRSDNQ